VTFIEAGGLERMREREIEDLKDEQRRLLDLETALARRSEHADARFTMGRTAGDFLDVIERMRGR
jgi:hypothetical protein